VFFVVFDKMKKVLRGICLSFQHSEKLRCSFLYFEKSPVPGSLNKKGGGEKVPSFIKQKVASSSAFFV
jgi:hypothetical protein